MTQLKLPIMLELEPTKTCNLRCVMCHVPHHTLSNERLDVPELLKALSVFKGTSTWVAIGAAYEPMMHPNFVGLIHGLTELGLNIELTTNGTLLSPQIAEKLIGSNIRQVYFSFDGISKKAYEHIRVNSNFEKTVSNICNFRKLFPKVGCFINYVITQSNLHEICDAVQFWESQGMDFITFINMVQRSNDENVTKESVAFSQNLIEKELSKCAIAIISKQYHIVLSSAVVQNMAHLKDEFPNNVFGSKIFSNRKDSFPVFNPRILQVDDEPSGTSICKSEERYARILWNGSLLLCNEFPVGNVYQNTFLEIWNGAPAANFRSKLRTDKSICLNCDYYRFCLKAAQVDNTDSTNFYANNIRSSRQTKTILPSNIPFQKKHPFTVSDFEKGNYSHIAEVDPIDTNSPNACIHYGTSGLLGKTEYALSGLSKLAQTEETRFFQGVTYWISGNEAKAIEHLSYCKGNAHAVRLLSMIKKEKIQVLSHMDRGSWSCVFDAIKEDHKFSIQNIGFKQGDLANHPTASIHEYFDPRFPPDFYITKMLEWHLLPHDLDQLPCPKFAQTADYDIHIQQVYPWLKYFDKLIVEHEWEDMTLLSKASVSTFPKAYPLLLAAARASIPQVERDIDIFISGTTFHPYHPDKSALLNQIAEFHDLKIVFFDGFLDTNDYLRLLARSKICITFIRRPGMPTRGLESLAMGCATLVQENSSLLIYAKESEGIFTYNETNLESRIQYILQNWDSLQSLISEGSRLVREEFDTKKIASQYFRYLTFLASAPSAKEKPIKRYLPKDKRLILLKGWLLSPEVYASITNNALDHYQKQFNASSLTASDAIDVTREMVLDYASKTYPEYSSEYKRIYGDNSNHPPASIRDALQIFHHCIETFPKSLVLRFNYIRTALTFGSRQEINKAILLAQETTISDRHSWEIDPMDDVFPWDYFPHLFNYRSYFDQIVSLLKTESNDSSSLVETILASIHYHLSFFSDKTTNLEQSCILDKDFPFYRFAYAKALLETSPERNTEIAVQILSNLATNTLLAKDACALLKELSISNNTARKVFPEFSYKFEILSKNVLKANGGYQFGGCQYRIPFENANTIASVSPDISQRHKTTDAKILYIPLEFSTWQNAKYWSYSISWGIEDALLHEGADCFTIPCMQDISPDDPSSWLCYIEKLCEGKQFDQIWFTANHAPLSDRILEWIKAKAPIRVGLFCESLAITAEEWKKNPVVSQKRQDIVDRSISVITHAIVVDEGDLQTMGKKNVPAFWFPPCVTASSICSSIPNTSPSHQAVFYGAIYGKRKSFLEHPNLSPILVRPEHSLEEFTDLPKTYDTLQHTFRQTLLHDNSQLREKHHKYLEMHRKLRKSCYTLWLKTLENAPAVVNLPQYGFMYSGRIAEAMAVGRPVLSWAIPNRPRTQKLFTVGSEILLFDPENPDQLATQIHNLLSNPTLSATVADNARKKLLEQFTTEKQIRDILEWIQRKDSKMPTPNSSEIIRLHLGCGEQYLEGYTNIDYPGTEHSVMNVKADLYADITKLDYPAGSVDEIRLHHVFEHFLRTTALGLLIRWHEWLKPGGKLVIETPDLEGSAKIFLSNQPWEVKAATVRHLAGDHSDKWAVHVDHWSSERFQHTLKALGFSEVKTTASNWPHSPFLANVTAIAIKGKNLSRDELLLAADAILWESTVSPVEQKSYQIWRKQLRDFLTPTAQELPAPTPLPQFKVESRHSLEEIHNFNQRTRDQWVAARAKSIPAGSAVLDVGAGTCPYRNLFSHCNYKTHDFKKYTGEKLGGTDQYGHIDYVSEITSIPVPNASFDVILCTEVLEHVPEPGHAIQEMVRILKPGGRLLLSAPLGSGLHQLPFHYYGGFSPEWYRYHASKLGLTVVEISPNGGFFRQLAQECHRAAGMIASMPQTAAYRTQEMLKLLAETLPQQFFAIEDSVLVDQFTVGYHVELKKD